MATDKLYTVCGTSIQNGQMKTRFANDITRVKVLARSGHTDIVLVELPHAMNKTVAVEWIRQQPEFQSEEQQATIVKFLDAVKEPSRTETIAQIRQFASDELAVTEILEMDTELAHELDTAPF